MIHLLYKQPSGFIFPFVLFFITAGILLIAEIFSFENIQNNYDDLASEQSYVQKSFYDEIHIFDTLLKKTNLNSTGTTAGSDNDDYNIMGSGGIGLDDDEDAFTYKVGILDIGKTQNILFLNPEYASYSNNLILSNLSSINLIATSSGILTLYKLDANNHMLDKKDFLITLGSNDIDLTTWNNNISLALFLKNGSGIPLNYTLHGIGGNIIGAKNLSSGHYNYYANILIPRSNGTFAQFVKLFSK